MDSDPDIEIIDKDSGMASIADSKDDTPERKVPEQQNTFPVATMDNADDEPDETLAERLWGLTEMFPERVRNVCGAVTNLTERSVKGMYSFSCNASWIFFTSSVILFAPVIFETERAQMEEMQRSQQKQVLLGPGIGAGGAVPGGPPALPPMTRA